MRIQHIESINVVGIRVRTKNIDERNPETAKIGKLWSDFYSKVFSRLNGQSRVYGVYTKYESDQNASFDVIACSDPYTTAPLEDTVNVRIESGKYRVFAGQGEMPQIVIDLWEQVWSYFSSPNCHHTRVYRTDFECYKNKNEVEIFIGIK